MDSSSADLREHTPHRTGDAWVEAVPEVLRALKINAARGPGQADWTLTPSSRVGFASVAREGTRTIIRVVPKIDALDVFFLADYAFGNRGPVSAPMLGPALLKPEDRDPTTMLLLWFVRDIDAFARRWLRRTYRSERRVLDGEIRGEILFDQYIEEHVALADPVRVPAQLNERTLDTPNNRLLKASLRHASALSHLLPVPAARAAVRRAVSAALPRFAQVVDVTPTPANLRGVSVVGPQRHYGPVVDRARDFLAGALLGDAPGSQGMTAFTIDLPLLFQEALRGVLTSTDGVDLDARRARARIVNSSGQQLSSSPVDPDYVLRPSGLGASAALVLDAKYKRAVEYMPKEDGTEDTMIIQAPSTRLRIKRADVYQATAYRHHQAWSDASAALVYPVSVPAGAALPKAHAVEGFDAPVHILFFDVGPRASNHLEAFRKELIQIVGTAPTVTLAS